MEPRQCRDFDAAHALELSHSRPVDHSLCSGTYVDSRRIDGETLRLRVLWETGARSSTLLFFASFASPYRPLRLKAFLPQQFPAALRRLFH